MKRHYFRCEIKNGFGKNANWEKVEFVGESFEKGFNGRFFRLEYRNPQEFVNGKWIDL